MPVTNLLEKCKSLLVACKEKNTLYAEELKIQNEEIELMEKTLNALKISNLIIRNLRRTKIRKYFGSLKCRSKTVSRRAGTSRTRAVIKKSLRDKERAGDGKFQEKKLGKQFGSFLNYKGLGYKKRGHRSHKYLRPEAKNAKYKSHSNLYKIYRPQDPKEMATERTIRINDPVGKKKGLEKRSRCLMDQIKAGKYKEFFGRNSYKSKRIFTPKIKMQNQKIVNSAKRLAERKISKPTKTSLMKKKNSPLKWGFKPKRNSSPVNQNFRLNFEPYEIKKNRVIENLQLSQIIQEKDEIAKSTKNQDKVLKVNVDVSKFDATKKAHIQNCKKLIKEKIQEFQKSIRDSVRREHKEVTKIGTHRESEFLSNQSIKKLQEVIEQSQNRINRRKRIKINQKFVPNLSDTPSFLQDIDSEDSFNRNNNSHGSKQSGDGSDLLTNRAVLRRFKSFDLLNCLSITDEKKRGYVLIDQAEVETCRSDTNDLSSKSDLLGNIVRTRNEYQKLKDRTKRVSLLLKEKRDGGD
jgi:hypothetical protein